MGDKGVCLSREQDRVLTQGPERMHSTYVPTISTCWGSTSLTSWSVTTASSTKASSGGGRCSSGVSRWLSSNSYIIHQEQAWHHGTRPLTHIQYRRQLIEILSEPLRCAVCTPCTEGSEEVPEPGAAATNPPLPDEDRQAAGLCGLQ